MRRLTGDTAAVPLIADPNINEHSPSLSPDGKWLAYVSDESGLWELYVRPFPEVNDGRWQVSTAGGSQPVWARDGSELFYMNQRGDLMSAEILAGSSFAVGQQSVLFNTAGYYTFAFHPQYDVSTDGQQFVMIRFRGVGEAGDLVVVENFLQELKTKVGN